MNLQSRHLVKEADIEINLVRSLLCRSMSKSSHNVWEKFMGTVYWKPAFWQVFQALVHLMVSGHGQVIDPFVVSPLWMDTRPLGLGVLYHGLPLPGVYTILCSDHSESACFGSTYTKIDHSENIQVVTDSYSLYICFL